MNYPVWQLDGAGGGLLIAMMAIFHVYISHFAVGGGFVEVRPDKVVLLARSGEFADEIDAARAELALQQAEEYLASPEREKDQDRTVAMEAALRRSRVRLNIARQRRSGRRTSDRPPA